MNINVPHAAYPFGLNNLKYLAVWLTSYFWSISISSNPLTVNNVVQFELSFEY